MSSINTESNQSCFIVYMLALLCCLTPQAQAYPAFYMQAIPRQHTHLAAAIPIPVRHAAQKRAFDRLDISPFDFDAMTKRFSDDELSALPFDDLYALEVPRKRAFDRLEDSGFFGLKKRAFDRLDNSFMLLKRASGARK